MAETRISQTPTLIEFTLQGVRISQAPTLIEIDTVQVRASQLLTLIELEPLPVRTVIGKLEIDWTGTGDYSDESANLISARGETKLTAPGSAIMSPRGSVDRMIATLYNRDHPTTGRRYSPLNTAGPLYAALQEGGAWHRPMRYSLSIDNGQNYTRIFTGVIKIPTEGVPTPKQEATVDIDCRSVDELLLPMKFSTLQSSLQANVNAEPDESTLIAQVLVMAEIGMTPEEMQLDPGCFPIAFFWLDDESPLDELWQLAAAAGGRLYANPDGLLVYENMQHWLFHHLPTEILTRADYEQLRLAYDDKDLYSATTVEAAPRRIGANATLWKPDEAIQIPAGGSRTVTARLKQPAYVVDPITFQSVTTGGANITAQISLTTTVYAQRVEMVFTNANPTYAGILYGLQITGQPITGAPTIEEKAASTAPFWSNRTARNRSLRGNVYIQSRAQARALAEFLRDTQETPKLTYTLTNLLGKPSRRPGERIRIDDSEVMSAPHDAYITAITWSVGAFGYRQSLEAIDAANVYKYELAAYFIIGEDTLGSGKRVFY